MDHCGCSSSGVNPPPPRVFSCPSNCNMMKQPSIPSSSVYYEDPYPVEPPAPTFSLGDQALWSNEGEELPCTIRWIGRIPQLYHGWSVGIEFEEPVQNGGDGCFNGRRYFSAPARCALFVPSTELLGECVPEVEVQPRRINGYRHAHCHPDQDIASNQYPHSCRDSTYGYYRQCCNYSSWSRGVQQCGPHICENGPIYGRISVRQSLHNNEQPYESYCVQNSTDQSHPYGFLRPHSHQDFRRPNTRFSHCGHVSNRNTRDEEQVCELVHPDDRLSPTNVQYRESVFSPRSTIRLISGLKEWVSCWILGTSRRKRKQKIVVSGRKSIATSFVLTDHSGSLSRTGKRLSSFGDYSSVEVSTLKKALESQQKPVAQAETSQENPDSARKNVSLPSTSVNPRTKPKPRGYKKKQAPPPPVQHQPGNSKPPLPSSGKSRTRVRDIETTSVNGKSTPQVVRNEREASTAAASAGRNNKNPSGDHAAASTSSARVRKSPKKHRAPLPPLPKKVSHLNRRNTNYTSGKHQITLTQSGRHSFRVSPKYADFANEFVDDDGWLIIPPFDVGVSSQRNSKVSSKSPVVAEDSDTSNGELENVNNVRRQSMAFSAEDDSEEDVGGGIVPYQQHRAGKDDSSNSDISASFYKKNDKLLKISISKTETNVFTLEECDQSSETAGEDEDEDDNPSSLSESSNHNNTDGVATQFDDGEVNRPMLDARSSSSEESLHLPENKPIFEELRLAPPSKASVKDFVNAFNMLAARECHADYGKSKKNQSSVASKPYIEHPLESRSTEKLLLDGAEIKSFPTKWQYQRNGADAAGMKVSHFLLPIEEESHDSSGGENDIFDSRKNDKNGQKKLEVASKKIEQDKESLQLSETSNGSQKDFPQVLEKNKHHQQLASNRAGPSVTKVSDAALSILSGKPEKASVSKGEAVKPKSSNSKDSKKEQPIVVSLYIEDKSSHRGPIPFIVKPSMSLWKLKKKVEKEYNFDKNLQCWILGEKFAIHDDASLASYGVSESGCPILLYVMSVDSKSLPLRSVFKSRKAPIYDDVAKSSSDSDSENISNVLDREIGRSNRRKKSQQDEPVAAAKPDIYQKIAPKYARNKTGSFGARAKTKSPNSYEKEASKKKSYHALVELDDVDLVKNSETFECPVCFVEIEPGGGAILQDCLHSFCRECLSGVIEFSETAMVKCPFRNDEYSCESHLQEREIKSLVSADVFERHLQRGMKLAESQALNSFHCKTPDCQGWCLYEDNVNTFYCPVCKHTNCLTCGAIHEGKNCRQYQDHVASHCDSSEEAKKTKEYLENMVKDGDAMKCPKCEVILMKKWGCDWLKCSMCHTEVCWVTKGPRWGPGGRGDTSGGCKCMLNGVRCHPKCSYCH